MHNTQHNTMGPANTARPFLYAHTFDQSRLDIEAQLSIISATPKRLTPLYELTARDGGGDTYKATWQHRELYNRWVKENREAVQNGDTETAKETNQLLVWLLVCGKQVAKYNAALRYMALAYKEYQMEVAPELFQPREHDTITPQLAAALRDVVLQNMDPRTLDGLPIFDAYEPTEAYPVGMVIRERYARKVNGTKLVQYTQWEVVSHVDHHTVVLDNRRGDITCVNVERIYNGVFDQ